MTRGQALALLAGIAPTLGCQKAVSAPDLATRIAATCAPPGRQILLTAYVPGAWDTVWLVNRPSEADLDALPGLPSEARKVLAEWDNGLGTVNVMIGTHDRRVAWTDVCDNNINESFEPRPCWWVVGDGASGWARRSREAAAFDVARHVGPNENSIMLKPIDSDVP